MSIRIRASSEPNISSASFLARWVLPTPVGPKNINTPIGWLGSCSPTRLRCIAFTIFSIALSWAITSFFSLPAMFLSLSPSDSATLCTGMPVIIATTSATSSAVTFSLSPALPSAQRRVCSANWSSSFCCWSRKLAASSKFWFCTACSFLSFISFIWSSSDVMSTGMSAWCRCILAPTSSRASIALSGKARSVM